MVKTRRAKNAKKSKIAKVIEDGDKGTQVKQPTAMPQAMVDGDADDENEPLESIEPMHHESDNGRTQVGGYEDHKSYKKGLEKAIDELIQYATEKQSKPLGAKGLQSGPDGMPIGLGIPMVPVVGGISSEQRQLYEKFDDKKEKRFQRDSGPHKHDTRSTRRQRDLLRHTRGPIYRTPKSNIKTRRAKVPAPIATVPTAVTRAAGNKKGVEADNKHETRAKAKGDGKATASIKVKGQATATTKGDTKVDKQRRYGLRQKRD